MLRAAFPRQQADARARRGDRHRVVVADELILLDPVDEGDIAFQYADTPGCREYRRFTRLMAVRYGIFRTPEKTLRWKLAML